ncbi:MAG: hypothetical protein AAB573_05260 [Patescibacteria group bacterium]
MSEFPSTRKLYKRYSGANRLSRKMQNYTPQSGTEREVSQEIARRAVLTASTAANLLKPEAGNALLGFQQAPKKRNNSQARVARLQRTEAIFEKYSEKLNPTTTNSNTSFQWNRLQRGIAMRVASRTAINNLLTNPILRRDARRRSDDGTNYYA